MVNIAVLACVLRTTTKKSRQLFREKKCTPPYKILATPMHGGDIARGVTLD